MTAMGASENRPNVRFLGEQDGIPERSLKGALVGIFDELNCVDRAYLVRVCYGQVPAVHVALAVVARPDVADQIVRRVQVAFSSQFSSDEHLDICIVPASDEATISQVCSAFYPNKSGQSENRSDQATVLRLTASTAVPSTRPLIPAPAYRPKIGIPPHSTDAKV